MCNSSSGLPRAWVAPSSLCRGMLSFVGCIHSTQEACLGRQWFCCLWYSEVSIARMASPSQLHTVSFQGHSEGTKNPVTLCRPQLLSVAPLMLHRCLQNQYQVDNAFDTLSSCCQLEIQPGPLGPQLHPLPGAGPGETISQAVPFEGAKNPFSSGFLL